MSSGNVNLNQSSSPGGFAKKYQEDGDPTADQAHHFAFYFQLGYKAGALEASAVGVILDFTNAGDRELAGAAAAIGQALKNSQDVDSVSAAIRELCKWRGIHLPLRCFFLVSLVATTRRLPLFPLIDMPLSKWSCQA